MGEQAGEASILLPESAPPGASSAPPQAVSLWEIAAAFGRIGTTSFGGSVTSWMMREVVWTRQWLNEVEFLTGLAMAQALPGVNVVNLPLWIGYRLAGVPGALAAASGVIFPPGIFVAIFYASYAVLSAYPETNRALQGAAAAAIGLSLAMGLRAARRQVRKLVPALLLVATFLGVGVLHQPMILVLLVLAPLGVGHAYWEATRP